MSSPQDVAKAFIGHYYQQKDTNAEGLASLFKPESMMTFEGQQMAGPQAIVEKLKSIGQVKHTIREHDVQPSTSHTAMLIFVTGLIQIGGDNPLHFCEMVQLVSTGANQFYVHNSIFRLNYG